MKVRLLCATRTRQTEECPFPQTELYPKKIEHTCIQPVRTSITQKNAANNQLYNLKSQFKHVQSGCMDALFFNSLGTQIYNNT
jgi:hypothetical protein